MMLFTNQSMTYWFPQVGWWDICLQHLLPCYPNMGIWKDATWSSKNKPRAFLDSNLIIRLLNWKLSKFFTWHTPIILLGKVECFKVSSTTSGPSMPRISGSSHDTHARFTVPLFEAVVADTHVMCRFMSDNLSGNLNQNYCLRNYEKSKVQKQLIRRDPTNRWVASCRDRKCKWFRTWPNHRIRLLQYFHQRKRKHRPVCQWLCRHCYPDRPCDV